MWVERAPIAAVTPAAHAGTVYELGWENRGGAWRPSPGRRPGETLGSRFRRWFAEDLVKRSSPVPSEDLREVLGFLGHGRAGEAMGGVLRLWPRLDQDQGFQQAVFQRIMGDDQPLDAFLATILDGPSSDDQPPVSPAPMEAVIRFLEAFQPSGQLPAGGG